jgi:large subunit ribosomal protein L22
VSSRRRAHSASTPVKNGRGDADMAVKTNERPGTRAMLRHSPMSSYKVREVLDLIRGLDYVAASDVLEYCERAAAPVVEKLLKSAAANAEHNDGLVVEELYVASAFADEGATQKRWRPRARGRASRIRKRSCHITLVLARMDDEKIARRRARVTAEAAERRARRVQGARRRGASEAEAATPAIADVEDATLEEAAATAIAPEAAAIEETDAVAYAEVDAEETAADVTDAAGVEESDAEESDSGVKESNVELDDAAETASDDVDGAEASDADTSESEI